MFVILILSIVLHNYGVSSVLKYEITAVYMADTEKYIPYTEPRDESVWVRKIQDASNLGLLFAGKSEFIWLVDLRLHHGDQELWSTGNLFSSRWVMTTCTANRYLDEAWRVADRDTQEITKGAVVTFFRQYYWEFVLGDNWHDYKGKWVFGGTRRILSAVVHPRCDVKKMKYDIAMLKLTEAISPSDPFIGYMPYFAGQGHAGDVREFADVNFRRLEAQRRICFVGSIGRDYVNWKYHLVSDFKVRYRVYYEEIAKCTNLVNRLCNSSRHECKEAFAAPSASGRRWTCMRTRAKVGSVCDHDRGSPVVCDDEVVGMVVYGALFPYCNNLIPMPFLVVKLHSFSDWTNGISLGLHKRPWGNH